MYSMSSLTKLIQICLLIMLIVVTTHQQAQQSLHDKIGNLTQSQLNAFYSLVREAQGNFSSDQKNQMTRYISAGMGKSSGLYAWSVFISGKDTNRGVLTGWIPSDKYLWRINYGKYNFTYFLWCDVTCYGMGGGGSSVQFGQSIPTGDQDKIKQIVRNSIIYRGDNMEDAADYIKTKLKQSIKGYWTVVIAAPTEDIGYYECRTKQFWVSLKSFGQLKWNYFFSKNY